MRRWTWRSPSPATARRRCRKGRAWGVAVHESFGTVVAYVVEASVKDGAPKLHKATAAVHCNLAVNPLSIEAQIQGAALMAWAPPCRAPRSR
jgi:isoquinoline 1-oxidoreductase beta subunit